MQLDSESRDYIDARLAETERVIGALIKAVDDRHVAAWETHRHQHYAAERGHADLHKVHDEAHQREHGYTEEALQKAENQTMNRLKKMNAFKEQVQTQAATHVSAATMNEKLENYVTVKEFSTIKAIVYGAVALILTSFMGGMIALIVVDNGGA